MYTNSPDNRYGSLAAEIYDIDKPFGKLPDTAFYRDALKGLDGPILEPACGSGRTLVPLAEAGHEMWGFDTSAEMLAQAEPRCAKAGVRARLSQQGWSDFTYDQRFSAIILPVASFTLIEDADTAFGVLARFYAALSPGGLLLIDLTPLSTLAPVEDDRRSWVAENGDLLTLHAVRTGTDWTKQAFRLSVRYERWRENRLVAAELEPMVMRQWGIEEFRMALNRAGFTGAQCHGDYRRGEPPGAGTRMVTWEARKPA